ncbi:MAG: hypothetical protein HC933_04990, partial [Pleurocapsa sp. SU_196_0]|nr:hypothetical protein [Pleurocapsa sp. SU_196_0]
KPTSRRCKKNAPATPTVEELEKLPNVSKAAAKTVFEFLSAKTEPK